MTQPPVSQRTLTPTHRRLIRFAPTLFALAGWLHGTPASGATQTWMGGDGTWGTAGAWSGSN